MPSFNKEKVNYMYNLETVVRSRWRAVWPSVSTFSKRCHSNAAEGRWDGGGPAMCARWVVLAPNRSEGLQHCWLKVADSEKEGVKPVSLCSPFLTSSLSYSLALSHTPSLPHLFFHFFFNICLGMYAYSWWGPCLCV